MVALVIVGLSVKLLLSLVTAFFLQKCQRLKKLTLTLVKKQVRGFGITRKETKVICNLCSSFLKP